LDFPIGNNSRNPKILATLQKGPSTLQKSTHNLEISKEALEFER
jgi:hypothetical protein